MRARDATCESRVSDSAMVVLVLARLNASVAAVKMAISSVGGGVADGEVVLCSERRARRSSSPRALGTRTG